MKTSCFKVAATGAVIVLVLAAAGPAYASGSGMPWEAPLQQFLDSITGPVARAAAVIAIVVCFMGMMFSEGGSGAKKLAVVGLAISGMFAASSFFLNFFGFAGGATL